MSRITQRQRLQEKNHETRVNSRRKNHRGLTASQESTCRVVERIIRSQGGECAWSRRQFAYHIGISVSQFDRDMNVIVLVGRIGKQVRPGRHRRNQTNLWRLPDRAGGVGRIKEEEKTKNLNTNTTTAREVPRASSYPRERWEHNRFQNHPPALARLYETNGAVQAENRHLRGLLNWKQSQETRRFEQYARASVGRYDGERVANNPADLALVNAMRARMTPPLPAFTLEEWMTA